MSRRISLYVLLASSLTFLASLFLPWRQARMPAASGVQSLLNQFTGNGREFDGWVTGAGDVAVLLVVAIVVATIVAFRRPHLVERLPLGSLAVALAYFAVALALTVHTLSDDFLGAFTGHPPKVHASWAFGFYLGLASAAIALLSGLASSWSHRLRPREAADWAAFALGIALLIALLLPWVGFGASEGGSLPGIQSPPNAIAALGLVLGAGRLLREADRRWHLPVAIAIAILVGGAASAFAVGGSHREYGTWIGIAAAVLLVALETVRAWPIVLPAPPGGATAVRMSAAVLLIVALFLPWQEIRSSSVSQTFAGWDSDTGAAAGALCLVVLAPSILRAFESYVLDAVVAIVIFVSMLATSYRAESFVSWIGYGALVGIAAAGVLLVTAFAQVRPVQVDRSRASARAVPLALSILCVAAAVIPSWFILPETWRDQTAPLSSWLTVTGVLLGLYLIRLWALQIRGPATTGGLLTLVPLVLLTLPSLELIRFREDPDTQWGAIILVGLCLLLALSGWIEENRGLEGIRIPEEMWRVDRLPEAES